MEPLERFEALAEAVADGLAPDWASAETSASTPDDRAAVAVFRDLALVGGLFASASATGLGSVRRPRTRLDPGESWGTLRIKSHVGRGRFGDVYRANDAALDRDVALKLIDERENTVAPSSDVISEGRLMARVRHPNVVAIHGAQRIGDVTGLTMEFVEGQTLEEELAARGPFSPNELISTGLQMCGALAAVHGAGLVHRDVKASNILRDRSSGRVMLGDFGTGHDLEETGLPPGGLVGTPVYLAPEVFAGRPATPQSDLYSLGVLLFRLATGGYPFHTRSITALRGAHAGGERASLKGRDTGLPNPLVAIIDRALDPDPARRFESAEAMAKALQRCQQRPARHRALVLAAAAAVLLAALALTFGRGFWTTPRINLAERDAVLVTSFENRTGEPSLDGAVEYALELELADSPVAAVASRERVTDTLALMRRAPDTVLDWTIGREVAQRDGRIRVVVAGQVDRQGDRYRLSARLLEPASGAAVASVVEDANSGNDLMDAVARLARGVRERLGETLPALPAPASELPPVRTGSLSALRKYAEALPDLYEDADPDIARQLLEQAVREDPEFALAHIALARAIQVGRNDEEIRRPEIDRTIEAHLDKASELVRGVDGVDPHVVTAESEYLRSRLPLVDQAKERRDHLARAQQSAQMWHRLQPTSERAINLLIVVNQNLGQPASAQLTLARRLVELRPNGIDALHRAANRAARAGEVDEARGYMKRVRPLIDAPVSGRRGRRPALLARWGLCEEALLRNDVVEAREWARQMDVMRAEESKPTDIYFEAPMWCYVALGQLEKAEALALQTPGLVRTTFSLGVAEKRGGSRRAVEMARRLFPDRSALQDPRFWAVRPEIAWSEGRFAAARRELDALRQRTPAINKATLAHMEGELALAQGDAPRAIALFKPLVEGYEGKFPEDTWVDRSLLLAEAFVAARQSGEAIRVLEEVSARPREVLHPSTRGMHEWMMARDLLARLYREAGRESEASPIEAELRTLLALADADHPILRRLNNLAAQPIGIGR